MVTLQDKCFLVRGCQNNDHSHVFEIRGSKSAPLHQARFDGSEACSLRATSSSFSSYYLSTSKYSIRMLCVQGS